MPWMDDGLLRIEYIEKYRMNGGDYRVEELQMKVLRQSTARKHLGEGCLQGTMCSSGR